MNEAVTFSQIPSVAENDLTFEAINKKASYGTSQAKLLSALFDLETHIFKQQYKRSKREKKNV